MLSQFDHDVPSGEVLRATAIQFLKDGNEIEEANILAQCWLEVSRPRWLKGGGREVDVTLRCCRALLEKLEDRWDGALTFAVPSPPARRIRKGIQASLPSGFDIANFAARAGVMSPLEAEKALPTSERLKAGLKRCPEMRVARMVPVVGTISEQGFTPNPQLVAAANALAEEPHKSPREQSAGRGLKPDRLRVVPIAD